MEPQLFQESATSRPRKVTVHSHYIRTPDCSVHCVYGWPGEGREQPTVRIWPADHEPSEYAQPIDIRTVGLGLWISVHSRDSFGEVLAAFRKRKLVSLQRNHDGVWQLVQDIRHPDGNVSRFTYWIDEPHGFSAVRMEVRFVGELAKVFPEPTQEASVTWKEVNHVWVPHTVLLRERSPNLRHPRISSYQLRLEWKDVNAPLSNTLFTVDGLKDLPNQTEVYDHRHGKPVVVRVIERETPLAKWKRLSQATRSQARRRGLTLIVLNVLVAAFVLVLLVVGAAARRRRTKWTTSTPDAGSKAHTGSRAIDSRREPAPGPCVRTALTRATDRDASP